MAGNKNTGILPYADVHGRHFRISIRTGICLVEKRHSLHAVFSGLQSKRNQIVYAQRVVQRFCQRALDEGIHLFIILQQRIGMLGIGGESLESVNNQLTQTANVFLLCSKDTDSCRLFSKFTLLTVPFRRFRKLLPFFGTQLFQKRFLLLQRIFNCKDDRILIKIGIGDRDKKIHRDAVIDLFVHLLARLSKRRCHCRKPLRHIHQKVLHCSYFRFLSTYTDHGTSLTPCGLLTLITKHFFFSHFLPPFLTVFLSE